MIWKIYPFMKFEILGVFVHTLTADEQLSCSGFSEFAVLYSNAIMLKTKNFLKIFSSIDEI